MRIAVGLPQVGSDVGAVLRAAREAEDAGAWGVWVFDNLEPLGRPDGPVLEGWSLLGPLARVTSRVALVSLVTRAGLRHPALVARMAAVAQAASGGRLVLGLGAGDSVGRAEERRFGIRVPGGRAERLRQVAQIVERVRADPLPVRPVAPPPVVWIAGRADDLAALASRLAHGWHAWDVDPDRFARLASRVEGIERWWGGMYDPATAPGLLETLDRAGATGVTWMIASRHDAERRPQLLDLVRAYA